MLIKCETLVTESQNTHICYSSLKKYKKLVVFGFRTYTGFNTWMQNGNYEKKMTFKKTKKFMLIFNLKNYIIFYVLPRF